MSVVNDEVRAESSLSARAGRALGWSFLSTAVSKLSTLAIGVVLARLLGPAEFGTFAVATVALLAVLSFNELGVSLAIVRWPDDPRRIIPTVTTISVAASALIAVAGFLAAPWFCAVMGAPDAVPVVRVLGISVVVSGLVAGPVAMLQREFHQKKKMVADQAAAWTTALTSMACAVGGLGAMSLAVGQLAGSVLGAILFIRFAPGTVRFGYDREIAGRLLRFGLPLAGSSIVVFAVTQIDKVVVGAALGPVPLGFYVLATNLSNWPASMFALPVRSVAPALLARLQGDPPAMRRTFLSTAGLLAAITLPACVLLAAGAGPIVGLVYGAEWQPAAAVLLWVGLLAALKIMFELVYDYFVVLANTRVVFVVQVVWLVALLPALYLGARHWGPAGAGAASLLVALLVVAPIYLWELRRTGIGVLPLGRRLGLPLLAGLVVGVGCAVAARFVHVDLLAALASGFFTAAVLAALLWRMRDSLRALRAT
ncbi:lipopolysaccharide biosynthesis protein [Virgisporangium aliadipatigenens]|uniref:Lipopolysaccharide biosynthesis protein n=1 Tax=Virgisporangium aliadipatigenens TaxID=741659 RepID=A0A8J3YHU9_9ACTN|nr:lipopolysaccharide biosynthesis protein [Virgisporangium aliadipatigenens]GIJ44572.1 lipopolysaccharide biosynthesis protein [Virgisporangium aliadipatigenens]